MRRSHPADHVRDAGTFVVCRERGRMIQADTKYPDVPPSMRDVVRVQFERLAGSDF
jgi:hypothetical protein